MAAVPGQNLGSLQQRQGPKETWTNQGLHCLSGQIRKIYAIQESGPLSQRRRRGAAREWSAWSTESKAELTKPYGKKSKESNLTNELLLPCFLHQVTTVTLQDDFIVCG